MLSLVTFSLFFSYVLDQDCVMENKKMSEVEELLKIFGMIEVFCSSMCNAFQDCSGFLTSDAEVPDVKACILYGPRENYLYSGAVVGNLYPKKCPGTQLAVKTSQPSD